MPSAFIQKHWHELVERWLEDVVRFQQEQGLEHVSDEIYLQTNRKFIEILRGEFFPEEGKKNGKVEQFAKEQVKMGWPLHYLTKGLMSFRKVLVKRLQESHHFKDSDIYPEIEKWVDPIFDQLVMEYTGYWEQTHTLQRLALKELSAPLMPVMENITVMPLIGTIDTERAGLIMENLLDGVIQFESKVVLIDITGVPVVDTMVAQHLLKASEAVRIVGAECILVGIRAEIAQTIVNLGIQLNQVYTTSSLQKGIELALSMTDRKIIKMKGGRNEY